MDVSPKGDPPGFVQVLDEATPAIPDRLGDRRADTFKKRGDPSCQWPRVIVRDQSLRERMAVREKLPDFAIVVAVDQMFFHCAKCIIRSDPWKQEAWPNLSGLPPLAEAMVSAGKLDRSSAELQALIDKDAETRLY